MYIRKFIGLMPFKRTDRLIHKKLFYMYIKEQTIMCALNNRTDIQIFEFQHNSCNAGFLTDPKESPNRKKILQQILTSEIDIATKVTRSLSEKN